MIKKYWKELLFFGLYLAVLLWCAAPDIALKMYGNDASSLLYGAKFLEARYPSPLYTLLGHLVLFCPWGVDGGNLVLFLSVLPAFFTSILVFFIIKRKTNNKLSPFVGSATIMGCYIFFSQAIIIEIYALMACLIALIYFLIIYDKPLLSSIICGLCLTANYSTALLPYIVFVISEKTFRKYWYVSLLIAVAIYASYNYFVPVFFWEPMTAGEGYMQLLGQVLIIFGIGRDWSQIWMGLWMVVGALIVSLGLSLIPVILLLKDEWRKHTPFLCLIGPFVIFAIVGNLLFRLDQLVPFISFVAVLAGLGISKVNNRLIKYAIVPASLAMMMSMPLLFDIGTVIDENPTTARQMYTQLEKVKENDLIMCVKLYQSETGLISDTTGGHISTIVEYVNRTEDKHIVPVMLNFAFDGESNTKGKLESRGVNVPYIDRDILLGLGEEGKYFYIMKQIQQSNPDRDVYYYLVINNEMEKSILVKL